MTVTIKRPDGTEIVLTGAGAEVCLCLKALMEQEEPAKSGSGVKLTDEEDTRLTQLYAKGYRWFARDAGGELYAFKKKPDWGGEAWGGPCAEYEAVPENLFSFVNSTDDEPTAIEPIIRAMILQEVTQ